MNLADAQQATRDDPKVRAAVATSSHRATPDAGLLDAPGVEVELFTTIKDATAHFKGQKELLEKDGFTVAYGTVAKGIVILERDDAAVTSALIKRPAQNPSKGG